MQSFNTTIGVTANQTSAGQPVDFDGGYVTSLVITNNSGISIQYSLGSGVWVTVANGATATVGVTSPASFRLRKVASDSYPVQVGLSWTSAADETIETAVNAVFVPLTDDYAGILSAARTAEANGGGVVQLKAITYTLTGALPLLKNVTYRGVAAPWRMSSAGIELSQLDGGTRLVGDAQLVSGKWVGGTFNCFEHNPTDRATPHATGDDLKNSELYGAGVFDLIMEQFAYGIKAGALYEGGCAQFRVDNLVALRCSEWGFWFENCDAIQGGTLTAMQCQKGQIAYMASGASGASDQWNYGDGHIKALFAQGPRGAGGNHFRSKGIRIMTRGARGDINDLLVSHIGINGLNSAQTSTATVTNGSASVGVTLLENFGVDNGVYFSSTVGAFVSGRTYFVTSVSGDSGAGTITLAEYIGGPNITATASGTPTINTHGYSLVEIGGYGGSNSKVTYSTFPHIDAESNGTAGIVFQKANGCMLRANSGVSNQGVVLRQLDPYNHVRNEVSTTGLDCDYASQRITYTGTKPLAAKIKWVYPIGMVFDDVLQGMALYLQGNGTTTPTISMSASAAFESIRLGHMLRLNHSQQAGVTLSPNTGQVVTINASGGTLTLPTIVSDMLGLPWYISNPYGVTATINTSSGQLVNNVAAATSITLAANSGVKLIPQQVGGTFYWARY